MKKLTKRQRRLFWVGAALVLLRLVYLFGLDKIEKEPFDAQLLDGIEQVSFAPCTGLWQSFTCEEGTLRSLYLLPTEMNKYKDGKLCLELWQGGTQVFKGYLWLDSFEAGQWMEIPLNLTVQPDTGYTLRLDTEGSAAGVPQFALTHAGKMAFGGWLGECSAGQVGLALAIGLDLARPAPLWDQLLTASVWLWLLAVWYLILAGAPRGLAIVQIVPSWIKSLLHRGALLLFFVEALCCGVLFAHSGIEFAPMTKTVFLALSFGIALASGWSGKACARLLQKPWQRAVFWLFCLYMAFALTGSRIFVYPIARRPNLGQLAAFLAAVVWSAPVCLVLLACLHRAAIWACRPEGAGRQTRAARLRFGAICALGLLLPALYNLAVNNPGISSVDSALTLAESAHSLRGMDDWHPPFYCILLRLLITIWDSTYMVILAQYAFWLYVMLRLFFFARKQGVREGLLYAAALLAGLCPANYLHLNTIWKDIPYALSLLWLCVLLAKLCIGRQQAGRLIWLELCAALVCTYFFRKNGIVPFVLCALGLLAANRRRRKAWAAVLASAFIIALIQGPVYSALEVQRLGDRGIYIGLGQDILGVYASGGQLSEKSTHVLTECIGGDPLDFDYRPTYASMNYDMDIQMGEFIACYLDTFARNPLRMTSAVLAREDAAWSIFAGSGGEPALVNYAGTAGNTPSWAGLYPPRRYCSLAPAAQAFEGSILQSQWLSALVWRSGIWTLLALAAAVLLLLRGQLLRYGLILLPFAGHLLGLVLSTGWSDFRYFWPLNLLAGAALLFTAVLQADAAAPEGEPGAILVKSGFSMVK